MKQASAREYQPITQMSLHQYELLHDIMWAFASELGSHVLSAALLCNPSQGEYVAKISLPECSDQRVKDAIQQIGKYAYGDLGMLPRLRGIYRDDEHSLSVEIKLVRKTETHPFLPSGHSVY